MMRQCDPKKLARTAYFIAEAMLAESNRRAGK